jgi:hypothetical protein
MALEYTLSLATEVTPEELARALAAEGFVVDGDSGWLVGSGVAIFVGKESDLGRSIIRDAYQFEPKVYVKFRLDKFDRWESGVEATIKTTLALLREAGDGILLFNGETPILMSRAGRLTLNNGHDFWQDPARRSLVTEPCQMQHLVSL